MTGLRERVIALAGLAQALQQVRRIADTGQSENGVLETALDSVFRIDAASPELVYGDTSAVRAGLRLLRDYLANQGRDELLPRLALAVMRLERNFIGNRVLVDQVAEGIARLAPLAGEHGSTHPQVLAGLGKLYADSLSQLKPRVMVQGNPHYLAQADVVAEIRAALLAAVRSAVLWRQMGGNLWDFPLRRRVMLEQIDQLLA